MLSKHPLMSPSTPVVPIRVAAIGGAVRPGGTADIRFEFADGRGLVYGLSFDLLLDVPVFDIFQIANRCRTVPGLATHQLSVTLAFDPFVPVGKRRFRFVLFDALGQVDRVAEGAVVQCSLPVALAAPLGPTTLQVDRVLAGDVDGGLLSGTLAVNGTLLVDPDAPLPTPTGTATATPTATTTPTATNTPTRTPTLTATATRTATATATASASATPTASDTPQPTATDTPTDTPLPSPTATPIPCPGDCNGDGVVAINELVTAVNVSTDVLAVSACRAADRDGNGRVTIDELIAAVNAASGGC